MNSSSRDVDARLAAVLLHVEGPAPLRHERRRTRLALERLLLRLDLGLAILLLLLQHLLHVDVGPLEAGRRLLRGYPYMMTAPFLNTDPPRPIRTHFKQPISNVHS